MKRKRKSQTTGEWKFLQDAELAPDHLEALSGAVAAMQNQGAGSVAISALGGDDALLAMYAAVKIDETVIGFHLDATEARILWAVLR